MSITPISPAAVHPAQGARVPDFVVAAFNELIVEKSAGGYAVIGQDEAIDRILLKAAQQGVEASREAVFSQRWLDIEALYRDAGWTVSYDKPAYNESHEARFLFNAAN